MSTQVNNNVVTTFSAKDATGAVFTTMQSAATTANKQFMGLQNTLLTLTGVGAAAKLVGSFESLVGTLQEHAAAVKDISNFTGMAAERADGMVTSMQNFGLKAETARNVLLHMGKAQVQVNEAVAGLAGGSVDMIRHFNEMGVDIRKGPEASLIELSKKVKDNKISAEKLSQAFSLEIGQAAEFRSALQAGPAAIKASIDEVAKGGDALTANTLATLQRVQNLKNQVITTFTRMAIIVGKEVLPVIEDLLQKVNSQAGKWKEYAREFGKVLRENLTTAISLARIFAKTMLVNTVLQNTTGMGITGALSKISSGASVGGLLGRAGTAVGALGARTAAGAGNAIMTASMAGGGPTAATLALVTLGKAGSKAAAALSPTLGMLARFSGVATLIGLVVGGIEGIVTNFKGVRDFIQEGVDELLATLGPARDIVMPFFEDLKTNFKLVLPLAIRTVIDAITLLITYTRKFYTFVANAFSDPSSLLSPLQAWQKASAEVDADVARRLREQQVARDLADNERALKERTPAARQQINYNFPNSTFNITQKFAEGFEPDRVAATMMQDISALGERRVQSALSPLFSIK